MSPPPPSAFDPVRFRAVADKLGTLPRRLGYAQGLGLVRELTDQEIEYLSVYWPLLDQLERCLGDDSRIRFAALTSITHDEADVCEVVIQLEDNDTDVAPVERALNEACGDWSVVAWPFSNYQDSISQADLLDVGRVLVDRTDVWARLNDKSEMIQAQAEAERTKVVDAGMQALKRLAGEE